MHSDHSEDTRVLLKGVAYVYHQYSYLQ